MEKWVRSLSKQTALIYGIAGVIVAILSFNVIGGLVGGLLIGGLLGFSVLMLYKGITGMTPQENKESKNK